ncbi:acyltransferase [Plesiomonas shigelloides]|uniref:acyltransferase family protein n=1 Tax=Plesiomonas shigelloides TaxID=703 RepID=UPI00177D5EEE|nr:acyltransferase family protein [Plesiomonas shigelloides]QOH78368.1 acyltransferase [Plesiomonas shigelloides]
MEHTELNKPRIDYIDGIRGAAALSVVLFHFFWESMGSIMPEMKNHITAFFFNGSCAVIIFFILSGDSLSISFFKDRDSRKLIPIFLKRYFRLTFMVFITVMIVYFFMKVGFIYNKEAGITLNSDWLSGFLGFSPGILNAISYSFSNVYTGMGNDYNPFFWTMRFELLGSYFILLYLFCFNSMKKPIAIAIFMYFFLALCGSYMSFFHRNGIFRYALQWVY